MTTYHILNDTTTYNSGNGKNQGNYNLHKVFFSLQNHESAKFPFTNVT